MSYFKTLLLSCVILAAGCTNRSAEFTLDALAARYVDMGLAMTQHDKNPYIFIGDKALLQKAQQGVTPLADIEAALSVLLADLATVDTGNDVDTKRKEALRQRLVAMRTRAQILQGYFPASFDEETQLMFGSVVPRHDEQHFLDIISKLDALLPGEEELVVRMERFRDQFIIPVDKLEAVMNFTLEECRKKTKAHIAMPDNESLRLNIVQDKPYVGFTIFTGDSHSEIMINSDVPVHIERGIELGCHEAYPGHHTNATLIEENLAKGRGWVEYTYFPLYGPHAVVAEGIANFGVDVAYPMAEKIAFERDVLLPMAGLSTENYDTYVEYLNLQRDLNYARNEAARKFLYEGVSKDDAIAWLMKFGMETRGTATQRLNFIEAYRTYVICYNYGLDVVETFVKQKSQVAQVDQWQILNQILRADITGEEVLKEIQSQ